MFETRGEYEALVRRQVLLLERLVGHRIRHGAADYCPLCGVAGCFDLEGLGFAMDGCNSIYYSTVFNEWRCRICDYRRIS
jgi:hypothetical protein